VAKERAARRAEREAAHRKLMEKRGRQEARRKSRRELWRKISLYDLRRRSTGTLFARRNRAQRAIVAIFAVLVLILIWQLVHNLALQVALTALLLLFLPVLVIVVFDKRST
jgi:chromatin segregation and condensation protein Rec8/ScpA/Scc1 (kleisin family)